MIRIIKFREFRVTDLQFVRLIKPFEDAGLVETLPNDPQTEIELLSDVCTDQVDHYHFSHILTKESSVETPSTVYKHIHERDDMIPTLWAYHKNKQGKRTNITGIKTYHELQALLGVAADRGYVKDADHLL